MAVYGNIGAFEDEKENFEDYADRFQAFLSANDIPKEKKSNLLLATIGSKTFKLLKNLASPLAPNQKSYEDLIQLLHDHYNPEPLLIADRQRFWTAVQGDDESVGDFSVRLRKLSSTCCFGMFLEEALRDKLLSGLNKTLMSKAQKTLLTVRNRNLSFKELKEMCIEEEMAVETTQEIQKYIDSWEITDKKCKNSEKLAQTSKLEYEDCKGMSRKRARRSLDRLRIDSSDDDAMEKSPVHPVKQAKHERLSSTPDVPGIPENRRPMKCSPHSPPPSENSCGSLGEQSIPVAEPTHHPTSDSALERIYNMLEKIYGKLEEHDCILQRLQCHEVSGLAANSVEEINITCGTTDDLERLENLIATNEEAHNWMVSHLSLLGGRNLKKIVGNILSSVVQNELSIQYNPTGVKGKLAFNRYSILNKVLIKSIRQNPMCRKESEYNIRDAISRWFSGARDRNGNRKRVSGSRGMNGFNHSDCENTQLDASEEEC